MKPTPTVKTADKLFRVIDQLQALDGAGVTELANEMGLAKSTVHNYLSTLEQQEYVVKIDGEYRLGTRFFDIGTYVRQQREIVDIVTPTLEWLAEETGEVVWFVIEEHGSAVYLEQSVGDCGVPMVTRPGKRTDLHAMAAGKAILAHLPETCVENIINRRGLVAHTSNTITNPETLYADLETVHLNGFAVAKEEMYVDVSSIAAPITDDGNVVGAITIRGPAKRLKGDRLDTVRETLVNAVPEVDLRLSIR